MDRIIEPPQPKHNPIVRAAPPPSTRTAPHELAQTILEKYSDRARYFFGSRRSAHFVSHEAGRLYPTNLIAENCNVKILREEEGV